VLRKTSLQDIPEGRYIIPSAANKSFLQSSDSINKESLRYVYLFHENDSVVFRINSGSKTGGIIYPLNNMQTKILLLKTSIDFDVFTTPFKYRPAANGVPPQFNSNFNGSFYFGYLIDRYQVSVKEIYPGIKREKFSKTGLGAGVFIGAGSAFINPKFMNNTIDYEYDALAIDYGAALLFGIRNISTGVSVGFDFLTDKNRKNWVYRHKPWVGIFIGINLN
jgi:hypothetical protein